MATSTVACSASPSSDEAGASDSDIAGVTGQATLANACNAELTPDGAFAVIDICRGQNAGHVVRRAVDTGAELELASYDVSKDRVVYLAVTKGFAAYQLTQNDGSDRLPSSHIRSLDAVDAWDLMLDPSAVAQANAGPGNVGPGGVRFSGDGSHVAVWYDALDRYEVMALTAGSSPTAVPVGNYNSTIFPSSGAGFVVVRQAYTLTEDDGFAPGAHTTFTVISTAGSISASAPVELEGVWEPIGNSYLPGSIDSPVANAKPFAFDGKSVVAMRRPDNRAILYDLSAIDPKTGQIRLLAPEAGAAVQAVTEKNGVLFAVLSDVYPAQCGDPTTLCYTDGGGARAVAMSRSGSPARVLGHVDDIHHRVDHLALTDDGSVAYFVTPMPQGVFGWESTLPGTLHRVATDGSGPIQVIDTTFRTAFHVDGDRVLYDKSATSYRVIAMKSGEVLSSFEAERVGNAALVGRKNDVLTEERCNGDTTRLVHHAPDGQREAGACVDQQIAIVIAPGSSSYLTWSGYMESEEPILSIGHL